MADKIYLIALCGAADQPVAGSPTPLEQAHLPHLDALAARGRNGLLTVIDDQIPPESDSGALALLGYDPVEHYAGRGPLEGFGIGFLQPGSGVATVCFRLNMASHDPGGGRLDRRTARDLSDDELQDLLAAVRAEVSLADLGAGFDITGFGRHRGIIAFHHPGEPLSGEVTSTDPQYERVGAFGVPRREHAAAPLPCRPLADTPAARRTAELVNAFVARSAAVLEATPVNKGRRAAGRPAANRIILRDGGDRLPELQPFVQRHGRTLTVFGQIPAERGLARLAGGDYADARQPAGRPDPDYYAELAERLVADPAGVVYVHVKGPDEAAHDGDPHGKADALSRLDEHLFGRLLPAVGDGGTVIVTGDHATPWRLGIHSADPVPVTVAGRGQPADDVTSYSERAAGRGALGHRRACELLPAVLTGGGGDV
uniref:2 n=1 Tax=Micromonospora carbonacea TaxID=47853 RepID=A0A7D6C447_9ACTN|nr:2 [Micromonospora carbonacea] [Micromonospora carbonacea]